MKKTILIVATAAAFIVSARANDLPDGHIEDYGLEYMLDVPADSQPDIQGILSGQDGSEDGIAVARALYWKTYKTGGSDFQAAKALFSKMLFVRDQIALFFNASPDAPAHRGDAGSEALERFMPLLLNPLTYAPSEKVPESAEKEFYAYSDCFHETFRGNIADMNINDIREAWLKAQRLYYPAYVIVRNWAEEVKTPFPLPVDVYLFGLVQRWPYPTNADSAKADYGTLLNFFGKDRVFEVAQKVQVAMDTKGHVDASAFGVFGIGRNALFENHNPYEVLWMLLTKDNLDLTKLLELYRSQIDRVPLQLVIDQWKKIKAPLPSDPVEVEQQERAKLGDLMNRVGGTYVTIPIINQMLARDNDPKNNVPITERIKHLRAQIKVLKQYLGEYNSD